jgi:hypothetical protein
MGQQRFVVRICRGRENFKIQAHYEAAADTARVPETD